MFLPTSKKEMEERGWYYLDFLIVSGDAYVDHPSFAPAVIARMLESQGFKVGILDQPDFKSAESFKEMGKPGLGVLICAGNMDSMINHYTANKLPRKKDNYSPNGIMGKRPDYATIVYSQLAREAFPKTPIVIGGVEASLRRFAHYDFWSDKVKPSILVESGADLLVYGMAELAMREVAVNLKAGKGIAGCQTIAGVCYINETPPDKATKIPSLRQVKTSKSAFCDAFNYAEREQNHYDGKVIFQQHNEVYLVQNPPMRPMTVSEMDNIYALPYERNWHPKYEACGGIPAFADVKFSVISHRGCFGGCSFCAINFHQGRVIQNRSDKSVLEEVKIITTLPDFKGYINDIGGPTANFRMQGCAKAKEKGTCKNQQCMYPTPCKNLKPDHSAYAELLKKASQVEGVKKVFVKSGIRYDFLLLERKENFLRQLCRYHIGGQLKVAPEHTSPEVLAAMGKPEAKIYRKFVERFNKMNTELEKDQYLVPYFIAAHPACTNKDAIDLACSMKANKISSQQVQLFLPTPGSRSTCMYYTGLDPYTKKPIFVPKKENDRREQRAILQYWDKKNYKEVRDILTREEREDLIGLDRKCLVPPEDFKGYNKDGRRSNFKPKTDDKANAKPTSKTGTKMGAKPTSKYGTKTAIKPKATKKPTNKKYTK